MKMFGLDTNVIIRLLTNDDPAQRQAALKFGAGLGKDVVAAVNKLLQTRGLVVEHHNLVLKALDLVETNNVDPADALIACRSIEEGCVSVKTFDLKAARKVPGMELLS